MEIVMLKTFGNYLNGTKQDVSEATGEKLCRLGYAKLPKEVKEAKVVEENKEFKVKRKTK